MKRFILFVFALALVYTPSALAGTSCTPIYGGGEVCVNKGKIQLDKKVLKPGTEEYVDNLSRDNDPRYAPDQTIVFKLSVTNTGETVLNEVTITDTFPQYVTFVSGMGDYNDSNKTLTFKVYNLNPNETRTFYLNSKAAAFNDLPNDSGITCAINRANAVSSENTSEDNSNVCIEKSPPTTKGGLKVEQAPAVTTTPSTGPEILALFGLVPAGFTGWFLRKKTK